MGRCSNCVKATDRQCSSCVGAPSYTDAENDPPRTYYCPDGCQQKDQENHKDLCDRLQVRIRLDRATKFMENCWHRFRECAFDWPVQSIDPASHEDLPKGIVNLTIDASKYFTERLTWPFDKVWTQDEEIKNAALDYLRCEHCVWLMRDIIRQVLQGNSQTLIRTTSQT